jgi:RimJ/RimL family protein N-acetyltransferase
LQTGPDFSEEHVLRDGTKATLRHIRPEDAANMRLAWERLSATSRYRRFFRAMGRLDDDAVRYLCEADGVNHVAIVAGIVSEAEDGATVEEGIGVARFVRLDDDPHAAEMAVTIVDDHHGKGLGGILLGVAARAAHERGIERFRGEVLSDNEPMRALLAGLSVEVVEDEGDSIVFDVPVAPLLGPEPATAVAARLLRDAAALVLRFVDRRRTGEPREP